MFNQGELFVIDSPCVNICKWNNKGYCLGCFRSRYERFNWLQFNDFQKQNIINLCAKRKRASLNKKLRKQLQSEQDTIQPDLFAPQNKEQDLNSYILDENIQPSLF